MKQDKIIETNEISKTNESASSAYINHLYKLDEPEQKLCFIREITELTKNTYLDEQLALLECVARCGPSIVLNPYKLGLMLKEYRGSIFKEENRGGQRMITQLIKAGICVSRGNDKSELSFSQSPDYRIERYLRFYFAGLSIIKIYVKCEESSYPYELKISLFDKLKIAEEMPVYNMGGHPTTYRFMSGDKIDIEIRRKSSKPKEFSWKVPPLNGTYHELVISPENGILPLA